MRLSDLRILLQDLNQISKKIIGFKQKETSEENPTQERILM